MSDRHDGTGDLGGLPQSVENPPKYIEGVGGGPAAPTMPPRMSDAEKGEYEDIQDIFSTAAKVLGVAAGASVLPSGGTVSVVLGVLSIVAGGMSIIAGELADDPPRPAYAKPVVFKQRVSSPPGAKDPRLAPMAIAIQQAVFGAVTAKGYLDAFERLQGAYNANDYTWITAHRGVAEITFRQLVVDFANNGAALYAAGKALAGTGNDVHLSSDNGSAKEWIETRGVQAELTSALKASGLTAAEINRGVAFLKSDPKYTGSAVQLSRFMSDAGNKVFESAMKLAKLV